MVTTLLFKLPQKLNGQNFLEWSQSINLFSKSRGKMGWFLTTVKDQNLWIQISNDGMKQTPRSCLGCWILCNQKPAGLACFSLQPRRFEMRWFKCIQICGILPRFMVCKIWSITQSKGNLQWQLTTTKFKVYDRSLAIINTLKWNMMKTL